MIDQSWADALASVAGEIDNLRARLKAESDAGDGYLPAEALVFRAFAQPLAEVKVLVVGQDPYPTPGHAIGLSFAVDKNVRPLPRSLVNIYRELHDDLGIPPAPHGDLTAWSDEGVLLLNRVLTVSPGKAGSHRGWGWEAVTEHAIRVLAERGRPLVSILWGKDAAALAPKLSDYPVITSPHPSPLSAHRGFFGSRPFSRANEYLQDQGASVINWQLGP